MYRSVRILSREQAEKLIERDFPDDAAVLCFYDPGENPPDYSPVCRRVLFLPEQDLSPDSLQAAGRTVQNFFPQAKQAAEFIGQAAAEGKQIICQCRYGQGRSAGCAAAILEYFEGKALDIFTDFSCSPNQLIYRKLLRALRKKMGPERWLHGEISGELPVSVVQAEKLNEVPFSQNTAAICFYDPYMKPISLPRDCGRQLHICLEDLEMEDLKAENMTLGQYFPEAGRTAEFIRQAAADGLHILCISACGTGLSAGCAAAILQFYFKAGLRIFADVRYAPNKLVYYKIRTALEQGTV